MLGLRQFQGTAIDLFQGDITRFVCDAMVTSANEKLEGGGGGVDAAIHRASGPSLLEACRQLSPCPTGQAVVSTPGRLPCARLIHAVGPRWQGGDKSESALLADAYLNSLALAASHQLQHIAFPSLCTGSYAYPLEAASEIALHATRQFIEKNPFPALRRITFVLFDRPHYQAYQRALFNTFPETDEG